VNILCQSEEFDKVIARVKVLESENIQTKFRLESLENWFLKLNEKVEEVSTKIDTLRNQEDSTHLKEEMKDICKEFSSLKESHVTPAQQLVFPN
jgi:predicted  nucleic acid-binding Zn-ribbon protein